MHVRRHFATVGAGVLFLAIALGGLSVAAQGSLPLATGAMPHPLHIHSGNCNELGDVVAPLTDLTVSEGVAVGQDLRASAASTSFTSVPLPFDTMLSANYAINAHLSADQIDVYIACGEIGGVLAPDGSLTIGLRHTDGFGYVGIAYLVPGADGKSTDVAVFLTN